MGLRELCPFRIITANFLDVQIFRIFYCNGDNNGIYMF